MKQELIRLPDRIGIPSSLIHTEWHTKPEPSRDIIVFIPGGPGNGHAIYNPPDHSMAKAFLPYADILLFDPRSCGKIVATWFGLINGRNFWKI